MCRHISRRIHQLQAAQKALTGLDETVVQAAVRTFESPISAADWLIDPIASLGGKSPLQACRSRTGRTRVLQLLSQIEHGVFG